MSISVGRGGEKPSPATLRRETKNRERDAKADAAKYYQSGKKAGLPRLDVQDFEVVLTELKRLEEKYPHKEDLKVLHYQLVRISQGHTAKWPNPKSPRRGAQPVRNPDGTFDWKATPEGEVLPEPKRAVAEPRAVTTFTGEVVPQTECIDEW